MKIEHLQKFVGLTVIVQLREAMAIGAVAGNGHLVPKCNEQGDILCKDGSLAIEGTTPDELAMRPNWPIKVACDDKGHPEFRYAISDAVISIDKTAGESLMHVMYRSGEALMELAVAPEQIIGITVVRTGPIEQPKSNLVLPGN